MKARLGLAFFLKSMIENIKNEFLEKLKNSLSEQNYNEYIETLNLSSTHGMTLNLKKLTESDIDIEYIIEKFNAKLIYKNENFAYLTYDKLALEEKNIFPGKDPLYHTGLYYIQEPSAAMPLLEVSINPYDVVLDLCASPGGKTCEVLYNLDNEAGGFVLANEYDKERAKILSSNIERMGFDNAVVTNNTVDDLNELFFEYFDKIIIDAPCSGEGMFRKSEEAVNQWSEQLVKSCASIQQNLLDKSYDMLKPGGQLIYSTCTFSVEEDENNVQSFLSKYVDMKLIKMEKKYPFNSIGEGQFYAIMEKNGSEIVEDIIFNKKPNGYFIDEKILKKLHVLRCGIKEIENINGRIEPTHASTHNDNIIFNNVIDLDDNEIIAYLHGEVIRKKVSFNGFCKITYKGLGIGLAKVINGVVKNHYPKGLRLLY